MMGIEPPQISVARLLFARMASTFLLVAQQKVPHQKRHCGDVKYHPCQAVWPLWLAGNFVDDRLLPCGYFLDRGWGFRCLWFRRPCLYPRRTWLRFQRSGYHPFIQRGCSRRGRGRSRACSGSWSRWPGRSGRGSIICICIHDGVVVIR